jgi:hypothetical protein
VNYPTGHSINDYRSVCNRKHISLLTAFLRAFVNKDITRFQGKKRIVDYCREILGIDVVSCRSWCRDCEIQCRQREPGGENCYCVLSFHDLIFVFVFLYQKCCKRLTRISSAATTGGRERGKHRDVLIRELQGGARSSGTKIYIISARKSRNVRGKLSLTISARAVGVGAASQPLIPTGERSGLQIRIGTPESVSLCVQVKN